MGMSKSKIGYTNDKVPWYYGWNPGGFGCSQKCECCWARKLAKRMKCPLCKAFEVHWHHERRNQPSQTKKPGVVLVGFTHDWMDKLRADHDILLMLAAMVAAPQHSFVTLTQNPSRLASTWREMKAGMGKPWGDSGDAQRVKMMAHDFSSRICFKWPPPHIWNGLTIRTQAEADEKLPVFGQILGNLWVSYEPAWEAVDFTAIRYTEEGAEWRANLLTGEAWCENSDSPSAYNCDGSVPILKGIMVGHDNRKGAPGTDTLVHIRSVVEQCQAVGTPVFVKQIWIPHGVGWKFLRASRPDEFARYPDDLQYRDLPWTIPDGAMKGATDGEANTTD